MGVNDYTLHLLCHYGGLETRDRLEKARKELLSDFLSVPDNYHWFQSAMEAILEKKGMPIEEYLVKLLKGAIPFDEGAILLFARATGLHFGVIVNDEFWCTNYDNDCEKWAGMFMYCGNLKFLDTTAGDMDLDECYELLNLNAFGLPHGSSPKPSILNSPGHSSQATNTVSEKSEKTESNGSDDEYLPPSKRRRKPAKPRVRQLLAKVRKPITTRRKKPKSKPKAKETNFVLTNIQEPPARCTRSSKKAPTAALGKPPALDEQPVNGVDVQASSGDKSNADKSSAMNGVAEKTDKSIKTQQSDKSTAMTEQTDKSMVLTDEADKFTGASEETDKSRDTTEKTDKSTVLTDEADKSRDTTEKTDKSMVQIDKSDKSDDETQNALPSTANANNDTAARATTTGHLHVKSYGIKKSTTKERRHKCQHCDQSFGLVKELNSHSRDNHADKPFQCQVCGRTYSSKNALDRHSRVHTGFQFVCGRCTFVCQFRYEMRDHLKKHTGTQKWPCPRNDCQLNFSSKRGLNQHMAVHTPDTFACEYCPKTFNTKGYLRQHLRYHTGGFPTYCGFKAKNPTAKQRHQKNC